MKISSAAVRHNSNMVKIAYFMTKLKEARAAARVTSLELAKEKAAEERAALAKGKTEKEKAGGVKGKEKAKGKGKGKGTGKGKGKGTAAVAGVAGAAVIKKRGRPLREPGVCGQCRWLAQGGGGGHPHATFCPLYVPKEE